MIGNESIDLGLKNIYQSWFRYRKGKKPSHGLDCFQYSLEAELLSLHHDLDNGTYKHGDYRKFIVTDNKKREISVASVRDRVIHRLFYDYLVEIFDRTFIFDAWSCRCGKGLTGAIDKTQVFIKKYANGFVWRADIRKFFDNVDHDILFQLLKRKIRDEKALVLLKEIIDSFEIKEGVGMPIGNLTSQIFSNIYLNELDRFIKHEMKCKAYLRYGDDFVIFSRNKDELLRIKALTANFIENDLKLSLHAKNNLVVETKHGLKFLGVVLYPSGRRLSKRNQIRIKDRLDFHNSGSYWGVVSKHGNAEKIKEFQWDLLNSI
ncbi:MAG: reverse transcriptase/maturase family protein [Candidatus Gracilibacteria bacterium]